MRIRLDTAKTILGLSSNTALAAELPCSKTTGKPVTKSTVGRWGDLIPELQSRQLAEKFPQLKDHVLDPSTGLSVVEMRARVQGEG